jgi:hypothetical protein
LDGTASDPVSVACSQKGKVLEQANLCHLNSPMTANALNLINAQIQRGMKSSDIFRDIFGLAVRLLGLVFLYFGIRAVQPILDLGAIETAGKGDILNAILPVVFNLAVAWWLIGGGRLGRRAYPEPSRTLDDSHSKLERGVSESKSTPPRTTADMDRAEERLAPLVEKPKGGHPA